MSASYPDLETIWPGWKIEAFLGMGLGGSVYRAVRSINGIVMKSAVKIMATPEDPYDAERMQIHGVQGFDLELYKGKAEDAMTEIKCLLMLKGCRHVVDIEDFALEKREDEIRWNVYLRMELLRSVVDVLAERQRLTENEIIRLGLDLSDVALQCEKNNLLHRDFKIENIYITEEGEYKLGDFGIAIRMDEVETKKGNRNYMAPEVFWERRYGKTTDLYSLGMILYMLANGNKMPFFETDCFLADNEEKERAFTRRVHGEKIPEPRCASGELSHIILRMLSYEPESRYPDAKALMEALKSIDLNQDR